MNRHIKKAAVLGSGIMGSGIACHLANIGVDVLLLDMVPRELNDAEKAKGLTLEDKVVRNRMVNDYLTASLKSKPSPIYKKEFASRITTGNFDDDFEKIAECDWVIEVVVERLDIKKIIFEKVDKYRKQGTLVSSNTSGIPIHMMLEGRSDDFQKHFCGTHFFNPPRYLRLLEIIPTPKTDPSIVDFFMSYGARFLGKKTVLCKDTPAFIANRVGVYSIMSLFHTVEEMGLTIEEVDKLTGPVLGRPKSATFRTCDVVGLDTLVHVANGLKDNCPNDEEKDQFELPGYVAKMVENNMLGSKTGKGFYKKEVVDGNKEILSLDLKTLEYRGKQKADFPIMAATKAVDDLNERTKMLFFAKDKAGEFYRKTFAGLFAYVSNRIPEISDEIYKVDDALKAGFGWELGPFETWNLIGVEKGLEVMKEHGKTPAEWVTKMVASGVKEFYQIENGVKKFYDQNAGEFKVIPGTEDLIFLDNLRDSNTVWKNQDCHIIDLGDGILNLEFHTKMNTIGGGVLQGIQKGIDLAETEYKGLVISNTGQNFSAGANVGMIFMMAAEQEYDELNFAIKQFQDTMMRIRHSSCPVIVAPHNMALGGGCEMSMHADKVIAHAELYMGLVEFGVGLIPGGGGTKEFAKRLSDDLKEGDVRVNRFREKFLTIGQAQVSTSAYEAFDLGYLRKGIDEVVVDRDYQLTRAKEACLALYNAGYTQPVKEKNITVLGQEALGLVYVGADSMEHGHYISEHDAYISEQLGFVLAGGDLSELTQVDEQYLLDLERKAFLDLCTKRKTLERIQSIVTKGKILRN
ncbi:3-hydroxyacyl-CoA dehydrogenase NAD-binding domain-containing protein [Paracrocinitomix mangrovi]|uniref:3-hydroxyacyl-CoA dehydrogenase/enoyl-CoA hydratase family protein n=1 Tax=Paracrocinitomix mangrovi TaxID=2862509 RepID=UPI001C8F0941|nr:3-hydroxyacyl-CoA dehydrogenase/enoyl-CoA hydratase family protein [Paracrocinitomix mangrovi]UKN02989.1 3-hydroxyacyl-CoA dehydrogenase NAD-binding domain-containing protein [Paracrocinitomix mangrovi]